MKLRIRNFDSGLQITPAADKIEDNALYEARGIHRLARGSVTSRQGSTALHTVNAQAGLIYWNSQWYYGTSNSLYAGSTCVSSATYNGNRLTLMPTVPTSGGSEFLFVAGGSTATLRKIDSSNAVWNWGISPPYDIFVTTTGGTTGSLTTGSDYLYRLTYYNQNSGSRSNPTVAPSTNVSSSQLKLLLEMEGAHGSTALTDWSPNARAVATTGAAALTTAQHAIGNAALSLPGATADFAYATDSPDWVWGTRFTIACWAKWNYLGTSFTYVCGQQSGTTGWSMGVHNQNIGFWWQTSTGSGGITGATFTFTTGIWYHLAVVKGWNNDDTALATLVNGKLHAMSTVTPSPWPDAADAFKIGCRSTGEALNMNGYIDDFFVVNGSAVWTDEFTPSTSGMGVRFAKTGADDKALHLAHIPLSTDSQVTHNEIWRTPGNGADFYLSGRIPAAQSSYLDVIGDNDLGLDALQTDNLKPYAWFDDCITYNASCFWITRTQSGEKGRVYYSPIGRLEAVQGFINVTDDSDPLQKLVPYGTAIGVFSQAGFFAITGTNPYYAARVQGVPGTLEPYSAIEVPGGIAYEAPDGPRLLVGVQTTPLFAGKLDATFQGEAAGQLTAWSTGTNAAYCREEYVLSNLGSTQTLAVNLRTGRWRDLGIPLGPLYYAPGIDKLAAHYTTGASVLEIEKEGQVTDNGTAISFAMETKHFTDSGAQKILIRSVFVDLLTGSTTLAAVFVADTTTLALTTMAASSRLVYEVPINRWVKNFGLRITGSLTQAVEVYGIDFDVYSPQEVA